MIHLSSWESEHKYSVDYDYLTQIFSAEEIDCFHHYLIKILKEGFGSSEKAYLAAVYPERRGRGKSAVQLQSNRSASYGSNDLEKALRLR